ncbi:MAG: type I restriction enzyme HsdR N-terminal domain-containing protein [Bacteroidales bacterium]|nr:type I restriction enzyme HsdR N-terminal domain-containing protein [Bacteroidales bacterium]
MQLNLPDASLRHRTNETGSLEVYDVFRKKYVRFTPEEQVRQQFLHFLTIEKRFPLSHISVERRLWVNRMPRRFDAVVFRPDGSPLVLLEFKAPSVKLTQAVFDQIAAYNFVLKADYLMVSNGLAHYCCRMDYENHRYSFLETIPDFGVLDA